MTVLSGRVCEMGCCKEQGPQARPTKSECQYMHMPCSVGRMCMLIGDMFCGRQGWRADLGHC